MLQHQSPSRLRNEHKGNELKDDSSSQNVEFQLKSLEQDHSSLMKKYEQLSKNRTDVLQPNQQQNNTQNQEENRSSSPKKLLQASAEQNQSEQQTIYNSDYMLMEFKSKEERILQQLVENYKLSNKDLSQKLDKERQDVLDQRVQIHNLETEIKFQKKENQRLTSMIDNFSLKKSNTVNQNIQGNISENIIFRGSNFGEFTISSLGGETQNKYSLIQTEQSQNDSSKKYFENKIFMLEEQNTTIKEEKSALVHQNKILEENITSLTLELELLKNTLQNQQIKDIKLKKDDIQTKEFEIGQLKTTIQQLSKETQESSSIFQQKLNEKNVELEKVLQLNNTLQEQLSLMERNLKQKEEFIIKIQSQDKSLIQDKQVIEREQVFIKENERLSEQLKSQSNQIKQLNEQLTKMTKQQFEQIQVQKELQFLNQENEALSVQTKGQQETIEMLNQQIAILERISNETVSNKSSKKQAEEKTIILIKKELDDVKQKYKNSENQIEILKSTNQNVKNQICILEEQNKNLELIKVQSDDQSQTLIADKSNYLKLIDQLQQEICSLNVTLEENQKKQQEKEKKISESINQYKQEINQLQNINTMFEKQILNLQTQISQNDIELKQYQSQNNNLNEVKFLEERLANLQKQNDLYSQKIFTLESRLSIQLPPKDNAQKKSAALQILEEGVSQVSSDSNEKYKILQKSYSSLNEQCILQLKQIDMLNQTIQELQKTIKQNLLSPSYKTLKNQFDRNQMQIPSTSDFQDYQETSKRKGGQEHTTIQGFSTNNIEQFSPEKIQMHDLEVLKSNDTEKSLLIQSLQNENRILVEKIASVESTNRQLTLKFDTLIKTNDKQNLLSSALHPSTPILNSNKIPLSQQIKSAEKPPNLTLLSTINKSQDKELTSNNYNSTSGSKRQKIFEPIKSRNLSLDKGVSPNTRLVVNNIETLTPQNQQFQNYATSPTRPYADGHGHKRQHTLPTVSNNQQDYYIDPNSVNYNQRIKTQEFKRPNSFNSPNQIFNSEQKPKKTNSNEESFFLFSPINIDQDKNKKPSQDDPDDLMSNSSMDSSIQKMIYPHKNIYEYYDQIQINGNSGQNTQLLKFDKSLFSSYKMSKEGLLRYKQGVFLSKITYVETKEGLHIGCTSQQERDQDQIYLNLNLLYKNISKQPIEQFYVALSGSSSCQAFAKPTVSNWSLSPNIQSKQELFFQFSEIPFGPIVADVTYDYQEVKKQFQMYLPVNIVKFLEQRTISAERLLGKYLKIKMNPKNAPQLMNGFIIKSEKFNLDRKFALNINDFTQFLPHFQRIPSVDELGEYMMGGNDFQLGGSYLFRENNLVFYLILSIKTNKYATFEIFCEQNSPSHSKLCECILQNFIYLFIHPEI